MLLLLKTLAKVLKILNSEVSPNQIAAGFAFGVLLGLVPVKGLLVLLLLLMAFIININLATMSLSAALFKLISFALDPLANQIGFTLLTKIPSLKSFWTRLYNMPLVPYTRFNNTLVLGSLVIGLVLLIPLFILGRMGVKAYRTRFRDRILKFKIVQVFQSTALYRYYQSFEGIRGE